MLNNGYYHGGVVEKFSHTFMPVNKDSIKKPLSSDHQLMMSLLNRPLTTDQAMMLAFAEQRKINTPTYATVGVQIKGGKKSANENQRSVHLYAHLIKKDINTISITAPTQ
jgi:hypothetical protein